MPSKKAPWWRAMDHRQFEHPPAHHRPEWIVTDDNEKIMPYWYEWNSETWRFTCLLCNACCSSEDHVACVGHQQRLTWKPREMNAALARRTLSVIPNEKFDYEDPWDLNPEKEVRREGVLAVGRGSNWSDDGSNARWTPPPGLELGPPPAIQAHSTVSLTAELGDFKYEIKQEIKDLREAVDTLSTLVAGLQKEVSDLKEQFPKSPATSDDS